MHQRNFNNLKNTQKKTFNQYNLTRQMITKIFLKILYRIKEINVINFKIKIIVRLRLVRVLSKNQTKIYLNNKVPH